MKKNPQDHSSSDSSQFLMIDYDILSRSTIEHNGQSYKFTPNHKVLYAYLRGWQVNTGEVFPSHNKIADVLGVTRKAVEKWIASLVEMGLITKTIRGGGRSNMYTVLPISNNTTGRSYSENRGTRYAEDAKDGSESQPEAHTVNVDDIDDPFPVRGTFIASDPVTPAAKVDEVSVKQTQNNSYGDGYPNYPDYYYSPGSYHRDDESNIYSVIQNYSSHGQSTTKSKVQSTIIACEYEESLPF
ncbi:helix-turn-helix domain-containing protein [Pantoea anthophila]|uniref:helix-turn-helix domain-containing protein n=1 Tax=Pantoea anthophila TaxID=470931 RepID=UPI00278201C6|nr:helix-turn-helix domain-containing protein [Pantoea anthophila]MDQ1214016.1 DNA-binding MarR family transcriptional regulator [Pantoea anthophila]